VTNGGIFKGKNSGHGIPHFNDDDEYFDEVFLVLQPPIHKGGK